MKKQTKKETKDTKEFFAALKIMEEERGVPQEYLAEKIANTSTPPAAVSFAILTYSFFSSVAALAAFSIPELSSSPAITRADIISKTANSTLLTSKKS